MTALTDCRNGAMVKVLRLHPLSWVSQSNNLTTELTMNHEWILRQWVPGHRHVQGLLLPLVVVAFCLFAAILCLFIVVLCLFQ